MDSIAWPAFSVTMSMSSGSLGAKERQGYARSHSASSEPGACTCLPSRQAIGAAV
jgi:hypothetical protein